MKRLMLLTVAASAMVWAQAKGNEPPPAQPGDTIKIIELKNASPSQVTGSLKSVLGGLAAITYSGNTIIVRGSPEAVGVIEAAAMKLDVAPPPAPPRRLTPRVEMTVHLLRGLSQAGSDDVPEDLAGTVRQLHGLFQYKSYQLLDTLFLQGLAANGVSSQGIVPGFPWQYELRYRADTVSDSPETLRLSGLHLDITFPGNLKSTISTTLFVEQGQKTVVGKSNVAGSSDAIIMVVTPKIVEQPIR